jgi:hypothetical protein
MHDVRRSLSEQDVTWYDAAIMLCRLGFCVRWLLVLPDQRRRLVRSRSSRHRDKLREVYAIELSRVVMVLAGMLDRLSYADHGQRVPTRVQESVRVIQTRLAERSHGSRAWCEATEADLERFYDALGITTVAFNVQGISTEPGRGDRSRSPNESWTNVDNINEIDEIDAGPVGLIEDRRRLWALLVASDYPSAESGLRQLLESCRRQGGPLSAASLHVHLDLCWALAATGQTQLATDTAADLADSVSFHRDAEDPVTESVTDRVHSFLRSVRSAPVAGWTRRLIQARNALRLAEPVPIDFEEFARRERQLRELTSDSEFQAAESGLRALLADARTVRAPDDVVLAIAMDLAFALLGLGYGHRARKLALASMRKSVQSFGPWEPNTSYLALRTLIILSYTATPERQRRLEASLLDWLRVAEPSTLGEVHRHVQRELPGLKTSRVARLRHAGHDRRQ